MKTAVSHKSLHRAHERLEKLLPKKVTTGQALAKMTTLRVGGPAAVLVTADTLAELRLVVETITDYELPYFVIGRGSNILISDRGVSGIVVRLGREFNQLEVGKDEMAAGAAVSLTSAVQTALRHNLSGLEFAVGIPGTVGAAVILNAGAHGGEMSRVVRRVTFYTADCRLQSLTASELKFSYRQCTLPKGAIVLEARMRLLAAEPEEIKARMEANWVRRKSDQPLDKPSAGSMFKNPPGDYAGRLIEAAGLKGRQVGGARISEKHANFFVNTGGATAADFYELMRLAADKVAEKFGVNLESEVRVLGDWSDEPS